jgi:hypothetical protein
MASKFYSNRLKKTALSLALGLVFVSPIVLAQSSVGSLFGTAKPNATVTITNPETGISREITADSSGKFAFGQLAPGHYTVTSDGVTRETDVRVGTGSSVNLAPSGTASLETVTVTGSGINPIDVSSVESTTVFTQEQIRALPVNRDPSSVALLAPGTVKGDTGFGNLASFGGSSVAENGYYINGFDVTNIFNFLSYAQLPFEAIAEQQIKTGGYGAEYGRSLGGVISLVTKRGTNEWKGGAALYWSPESLREHSPNVTSQNQDDIDQGFKYFAYREDNTADNLSWNVYGGGPIVKDRLFVFGLIEGRGDRVDLYGADTSQHSSDDSLHGLIKIDWNITNNHIIELTGIQNEDKVDFVDYTNTVDTNGDRLLYTGKHGDESARYTFQSGGEAYIAKYTGYLTDNFTVSAQYGTLRIATGDRTPALLGSESCPRSFDSRPNAAQTIKIGCWSESATFVRDLTQPYDRDTRDAWRLDLEWRLGDHLLRAGYDREEFSSRRAGQSYTGGIYYRYFVSGGESVKGVTLAPGTPYVRTWDFRSLSGDFEVTNVAEYIEDSWQVTDNLLLYLGLRGESFENRNSEGDAFISSDTLLAPRLGFSWDVDGDSTLKVFGNAGRYYIPVASNTNVRASGGDNTAVNYYHYSGATDCDAASDPEDCQGEPLGGLGAEIGPHDSSFPVAPDPRTIAANNISPMYQDEFILGLQRASGDWTYGVRAIMRKIRSGMDDYCGHQAFLSWAEDNGYNNFDPESTMARCVVINPGTDVEIALDLEDDGNFQVVTIPGSYLQMPTYQRKYHALEFFFEKAMKDKWYMQGSYTLSASKGNVEGYINSTLEQTDAGITQDFDHALFEDGSYGFLPNDRRHTFKLFGAYEFTDEWRLGASFLLQSGRRVNCTGYINLDDPRIGIDEAYFGLYAASSFYCANDAGDQVAGNRGDRGHTPWVASLDLSLGYAPKWAEGLSIEARVFNVLNTHTVTEYYETSQFGSGNAPQPDPNFLNKLNFQTPRSVEFAVRYEF